MPPARIHREHIDIRHVKRRHQRDRPGPVATPIYGKLGMEKGQPDSVADGIRSQILVSRFGEPVKIAKAIVFLLRRIELHRRQRTGDRRRHEQSVIALGWLSCPTGLADRIAVSLFDAPILFRRGKLLPLDPVDVSRLRKTSRRIIFKAYMPKQPGLGWVFIDREVQKIRSPHGVGTRNDCGGFLAEPLRIVGNRCIKAGNGKCNVETFHGLDPMVECRATLYKLAHDNQLSIYPGMADTRASGGHGGWNSSCATLHVTHSRRAT